MINYDDKPIIACSSGNVRCAISLIRISGRSFLKSIQPKISIDLDKLEPRQATFCKVIEAEHVLDEAVLTFFKAPNSYNGEDVLELSVHGNPVSVSRIIKVLKSDTNIRDAYPGEFSLRAMNSGKLTLPQIEGLDLLLNANSIFSIDQGLSVLSGNLRDKFLNLYNCFLEHRSSLELGFDFLEDIGESQFNFKFNSSLAELKMSIEDLLSHCLKSPYNLLKPEIALVGLPNAGKSSLFNSLLKSERSIVTDIPGTTRDFISEDFYLGDGLFTLIDTAGIRETDDVVEKEGVSRSLAVLKSAFFKILVIDPENYVPEFYNKFSETSFDLIIFSHRDKEHFQKCFETNAPKILSKIGPIEPLASGPIEPLPSGPIEPLDFGPIEPAVFGPIEPLAKIAVGMSFLDNSGFNSEFIFSQVQAKYSKLLDFDPILIQRHSDSINKISLSFKHYFDTTKNNDDISIIGSELNILGYCISELIGIVSPDDVLHNIFDNFCIGK